ncbi:hypothetical protein [uncultured Polaribacter sp.]|uniref:hypothetical protein n=1 Tax=uncultured Polaribacter sp. TaxID=174711 RepID=UPI002608F735|nr:hypothetical protein [uncultured Polaribacter sp.]
MKNFYFTLLLIATASLTTAQETSYSKFQIIATAGIGFATIASDAQPNYNLDNNVSSILLNYRFSEKYGIATGLGHSELSGTGFNAIGNFFHERELLRIPLLFTMDYQLTEKVKYVSNVGLYAQTIMDDEYRFLNTTESDVFKGWNYGFEASIGLLFELSKRIGLGVNFNTQQDFNEFNSVSNAVITDSQKLRNANTIGLLFLLEL